MASKMNIKLASFAFVGLLSLNSLGSTSTPSAISTPTASPRPGLKTGIEDNIKNRVQSFENKRATISGTVTAVGVSSITVNSSGANVQVDVTNNTRFRRKFWGESKLSEISVGDSVQVVGKWTSDAKTGITAVLIRDTSIQKRFGTFFGTVKSLTSGGFVVSTIHRDDETVTIGSAKLVNRKEVTISASDVLVGHRVRVKGMWNNANKTITEVKEIKDFSLPAQSSLSPFASPSPTP